jgi:type II secretion system protein C
VASVKYPSTAATRIRSPFDERPAPRVGIFLNSILPNRIPSHGAAPNRAENLVNDLRQIIALVDSEFNARRSKRTGAKPVPVHIKTPLVAEELAPETADRGQSNQRPVDLSPIQEYGWLLRLINNAPRMVSLALGAVIAVELARASAALFGHSPSKAPAPAPAPALQSRSTKRAAIDVRGIVAAHLFGIIADDPALKDPDGAPRTGASLLLAGTLATENPITGLAIIGGSGPAQVYKVGASVGGALLHSVFRDHVILSRNGRLETLVLPRLLGKGRSADQAAPVRRTAELGDPARLEETKAPSVPEPMRASAAIGPDGKLRGFRVFPNGNRNSFDRSGLRGGDMVVAVNGASLQNQDRQTGQQIINAMSASGVATVTVERNGQRRDLTIYAPSPE